MPFFAVVNEFPNTLYLRADDPNIYGIGNGILSQNPQIIKLPQSTKYPEGKIPGNKGCNFYSAPWCIPTFGSRDTGKQTVISYIDSSVYAYITAMYTLVGKGTITLTNWRLEQKGTAKLYQVLQGSRYTNINGVTYFGGVSQLNTQVSGVGIGTEVASPIITNDFTFNSTTGTVATYQMPYNTFYAINDPVVISAIDSSNPSSGRLYFTLQNMTSMTNVI
jgi:hypothetical protein